MTTGPAFSQALYDTFIDAYANDYAFAVAGHPLFSRDFDRGAYDKAYAQFRRAIDTPEKLMEFGAALSRAELGDD